MDKPVLVNVRDAPVHARTGPTAPAVVISAFAAGGRGWRDCKNGHVMQNLHIPRAQGVTAMPPDAFPGR
ncbi:hypothetical protein KIM89_14130, partial [Staphylococcus aureus]